MINALGNVFGSLFKVIYDFLGANFPEPETLSFYAVTILLMTVILRLITLPLNINQQKQSKINMELQPKVAEIQKKYKGDVETTNRKVMELYQDYNYNPLTGCLPLLLQFPILLGFLRMFNDPVLYIFKGANVLSSVSRQFFWITDLDLPDPILFGLPLLAGVTQYILSKMMQKSMPQDPQTEQTQNMMNIMMPVVIFIGARSFPAGLALYWVFGNILQMLQMVFIDRFLEKEAS